MSDTNRILDVEITPELEAELAEYLKNYEMDDETKRRIAAFDTPIHWTTWLKILP